MNRRLKQSRTLKETSEAAAALRNRLRVFGLDHPAFRRLNELMMQTGLRLDRNVLLAAFLAGTAIFFVGWSLVLGQGFAAVVISVLSAMMGLLLYFRAVRHRRITRFAELLPDGLDVIVRAVKVGYPLPMALQLVARELPHPLGTEFALTSEEIVFGQDVRTSIENLFRRVGQEDLLFFVVAINVQYQTGGNLAEILSRLSQLIRQRARLRARIRTISSEGKASALILSLMPFILFAGISLLSPNYFGEIRNHPLVAPAVVYGVISLLIGNVIMYRMVNFKF